MTSRQLILSFALLAVPAPVVFGEAQCPGNAEMVRYHSLELAQIAISVRIDHYGPYEFMVDTGTQLSTIDPSLAAELGLKPLASIGVTNVSGHTLASVAQAESMEVNHHVVTKPLVVVQELGQLQVLNPHVRGILGLNFLAHFDILMDYQHKMICLDERREMRKTVNGEHIPLVAPGIRETDLPFTQPLLVSVNLSGSGSRETILNLDSGASLPFLFPGRSEAPTGLADQRRVQGSAASGTQQSFWVIAPQDLHVGKRSLSHVTFLMPTSAAYSSSKVSEDGLLPTTLFKRVFISYADHFAVLDPW